MSYIRVEHGKLLNSRSGALLTLMILGVIAAAYRFIMGLGATTSLSDQFPWGIWVAFDVLCGVAVTAGGFTTAAIVFLFFRKSPHGLVRPALLTAFLGYVFVIIGVLFDLGLPWFVWHAIIYWPEKSPMFVVAWCDMLLVAVLGLLFIPAVLDRFKWTAIRDLYNLFTPWLVVGIMTFFTFLMSRSPLWTAAVFLLFGGLALAVPRMYKDKQGIPILLVISGIIFSVSHQSALGTLFLLMQDKLHHLWWTPMLPLNFYLSAIPAGMAMVVFEATLSAKSFKLPVESEALTKLCRVLMHSLWFYFVVRFVDLMARGNLVHLFSKEGVLFIVEVLVGVIIPLVLLAMPKVVQTTWPRFIAASFVIFGLIINRFNVVIFAMDRPGTGKYVPSIEEFLITGGIVAGFMFFYNVFVRLFPIMEKHEENSQHASGKGGGVAKLVVAE